ncbi:MAG: serine--tRNA ligase [Bacilli bacterium]|nr:serine--tRNA ligase [Bacilli bacterium]
MIDIKLIIENRELVKENIKKKFQDQKLPLVDEVYELDIRVREVQTKADNLKAEKNKLSGEIGKLMQAGQRDEAEKIKMQIANDGSEISALEEEQETLTKKIKEIMMTIPNIIADDVPIGEDDSKNVEEKTFGEAKVPSFEIPYHSDIMATFNGLDKDAAGRVSGNGFYYLMGDIARLHSAVLAYARDFMIDKGFTYCIPPFMIHSDAVDGVMSFAEKENMMYKIEGEDLYLIGTSEHSMIAKFKDQILNEKDLPITMTSYSPCFRKEVGAHGIEERGVYRIHQFEKQEMIVICKPEESEEWYDKMWNYSVELFRTLDIPVRKLVCCSGDLADLKYRSCDIEAWSPRQGKYFEVCSCSNLTDAQARRLGIRYKKEDGSKEFAHTLNNTVIAPPRMLIAFLENNLQEDGTVLIPEVLRPYMGGKDKLIPNEKK